MSECMLYKLHRKKAQTKKFSKCESYKACFVALNFHKPEVCCDTMHLKWDTAKGH